MTEVQQLVDMGFDEADVRRVLPLVNSNIEQAVERLLAGPGGGALGSNAPPPPASDQPNPPAPILPRRDENVQDDGAQTAPVAATGLSREDRDLGSAVEISMREQREGLDMGFSSELGGGCAEQRIEGMPTGMKNVGNTCYVNSMLQTLLHIDEFRENILRYRTPLEAPKPNQVPDEPDAEQSSKSQDSETRRQHSICLASELRALFAYGLFTRRKCIDPSRLLRELVDERGQVLPIGSQEDVGEFLLKFLDRLDEGLKAGSFEGLPRSLESPGDASPTTKMGGLGPSALDLEVDGDSEASPPKNKSPQKEAAASSPSPGAVDSAGGGSSGSTVAGISDSKAALDASLPGLDRSLLNMLFFGEQLQVFSYKDDTPKDSGGSGACAPESTAVVNADGFVVSEEKSDFLQIFLDITHHDLYRSWEAANHTEVDYTTPSGATTKASTHTYVKRLPKFLFFQLQRVVFDQEKKAQVKLDEPFDFEDTIFIDRFQFENESAAAAASLKVNELRKKKDETEEALRRFSSYRERKDLAVDDVLGWAAECLEDNARQLGSETSGGAAASGAAGGAGARGPHRLAAAPQSQVVELLRGLDGPESGAAAQLLRKLCEACRLEQTSLKEEVERLDKEITAAHCDLRKHAFELYAIWVHQGVAGSGHYWAYLRDRTREDRWVKFDDALTSFVSWEEVRDNAVGQPGSNTSAYALVYVERTFAEDCFRKDQDQVLSAAEQIMSKTLRTEVEEDNLRLVEEQKRLEEEKSEQGLRQHAEAIFQHYAGLIHQWDPSKRLADSSGNPHDQAARKRLHDAALLKFESFLYRLHGEQEVWTYLLTQSIEAQRDIRQWASEDEPRIIFLLAGVLRVQKCYSAMLRERSGNVRQSDLAPLDMAKLSAQYNVVLIQAHIVDQALQMLRDDSAQLLKTIGLLALVWARGNLEEDDKFRQNEVLLIMSTLIYNTVVCVETNKRSLTEPVLTFFQPAFQYFLYLLIAVEWPDVWKSPVITRIGTVFPNLSLTAAQRKELVHKETILHHQLTGTEEDWSQYEYRRPEPSQEFFERHRDLYSWIMHNDEHVVRDFVLSHVPNRIDRQQQEQLQTAVHEPIS